MGAIGQEVVEELRRALLDDPSFVEVLRTALSLGSLAAQRPVEPTGPVAKSLAARALSVHPSTLDRAVRAGCPVEHFNGRRRFDLPAVRAWFKSRASKTVTRSEPDNDPIDIEHEVRRLGLRRKRAS